MKKVLCILIAIALMLIMVACGGDSAPDTGNNRETEPVPGASSDHEDPSGQKAPTVDENTPITEEMLRNYPETDASDFEYLIHEDYVEVMDYVGTDPVVVIPAQIEGKPVKELGAWLFANSTPVRGVLIPNTVETLSNLFINNATVELVICDNVKYIKSMTFGNCAALHTVILGDCLQEIGFSAFGSCPSLKMLEIPSGIVQIDKDAFLLSPSLVLAGEAGSYVETFANENGIPFEAK